MPPVPKVKSSSGEISSQRRSRGSTIKACPLSCEALLAADWLVQQDRARGQYHSTWIGRAVREIRAPRLVPKRQQPGRPCWRPGCWFQTDVAPSPDWLQAEVVSVVVVVCEVPVIYEPQAVRDAEGVAERGEERRERVGADDHVIVLLEVDVGLLTS